MGDYLVRHEIDCSRGVQLKKTGLMLVAYRSRPEETKAMRDAFKAYDMDQNGLVSREEFINVLRSQGYTDEEVWELEYWEAFLLFFMAGMWWWMYLAALHNCTRIMSKFVM